MFGDLIRRLLGGSGPPSDEAVIARDTRGLMGSLAHQVEDDPDRVLLLGSPGTPPELGEFGTVIRERPAVTEGHENLVRNLFSESGFDEIEAREIVAALIRAGAPHYEGDPKSGMLCEIFAHPGAMSGIRIESITKGPALHQVRLLMGLTLAEMPVPAGEVFVTINTTGILEGELATYVLDARGGSPTVAKKVVHIP